MPNHNSKLSNYSSKCYNNIPNGIDESTAFKYCPHGKCISLGNCCYCNKDTATYSNNSNNCPHGLNSWNTIGNGIGTESFDNNSSEHKSFEHKSLQSKISEKLYNSNNSTYVTANNAQPQPIDLDKSINHNTDFTFPNKILAGNEGNRPKIAPVITPPIYSSEYWRPNDYVVPSGINTQTNTELTRSGYLTRDDCPTTNCNTVEKYTGKQYLNNQQQKSSIILTYDYQYDQSTQNINQQNQQNQQNIEKYNTNSSKENFELCQNNNMLVVNKEEPEMINTPFGYNASQLQTSGLPSNLPTSVIERNEQFKQYNNNKFTSIIQPGVYSKTEIIEPINSNIGISFPQQFQPVSKNVQNNQTVYTHQDHRIVSQNQEIDIPEQTPNESNIYDPRYYGYGTNYRTYIDNMTGQPRFYYDDITVHRQNNFLTRNKLDFTTFAPSNNSTSNYNNLEIRQMAQNDFANSSIDHRTDLQSRLLRKVNVNSWQQKQYPLRR